MLCLDDGMLLYHGSYLQVPSIDLAKCAPHKDFGQGFYVTTSLDQARSFVPLSVRRRIREGALSSNCTVGWISTYVYHSSKDALVQVFNRADADWLHFVVANRRVGLFPHLLEQFSPYDIIGGKIANDRTAQTIQFYMAGAYGKPGELAADEVTIRLLLPNRLKDQFCFRTTRAVETLEYVGCESYDFG